MNSFLMLQKKKKIRSKLASVIRKGKGELARFGKAQYSLFCSFLLRHAHVTTRACFVNKLQVPPEYICNQYVKIHPVLTDFITSLGLNPR